MMTFVAFVIGGYFSQNMTQFMILRFLAGYAGGALLALGGGSIADATTPATRGLGVALFSLGHLTGPVILCMLNSQYTELTISTGLWRCNGGFVAAAKAWRWTLWLLAILGGGRASQ